jgi:hypothetical protein
MKKILTFLFLFFLLIGQAWGTTQFGYLTLGGTGHNTPADNNADIGSATQYTASAGDVVTKLTVGAYCASGGPYTIEIGVYAFSGGVPTALAGWTTITLSTTSPAWTDSSPCNIILSPGVTYVLAYGYSPDGLWMMNDSSPGTISNSDAVLLVNDDPWSQVTTWAGSESMYATVTPNSGYIATDTKDCTLSQSAPTTNYNGTDYFANTIMVQSQTGSQNERGIFGFDASAISSSATISSAKLNIYFDLASGGSSDRTIMAYRLTQTGWTSAGATWNTYDGTNAWTTPGGDYTVTGGTSTVAPGSQGQWMSLDVTDIVQYAVTNSGGMVNILLKDSSEDSSSSVWTNFNSRLAGPVSSLPSNPYLTINTSGGGGGGSSSGDTLWFGQP